MILTPDCLICCQHIAFETAKQVTNDESALKAVILKTMDVLKTIPQDIDSFMVGLKVNEIIEEVTGNSDPYRDFKKRSNQIGEKLLPTINKLIEKSPDPLWTACKVAVIGNLIDVIAGPSPESSEITDSFFERPFAVDYVNEFRSLLQKACKMVYLADNAGEVFFDRILIQKVNIPTDYFVKGFPFLNDAQYEDAVLALIDQVATIKIVPLLKPVVMNQKYIREMYFGFLDAAQKADLIVIKGQANYELFMPLLKGAFYLFIHKCPVIAQKEGANIGDAVFFKK